MNLAAYLALCICPRRYDRGQCVGRDLDPSCPVHSLPADQRLQLLAVL